MTGTRGERAAMTAGEPVDGWEPASRVAAAESEWALRQAELRVAGARLAAVRQGAASAGPPAAAEDGATPSPAPGPVHSALSDFTLEILTGGPATGPAGPA
ncbi:hypothetical protein [Streptomyces sp. NBC_00102]|uniref:hypothetical protein n=1 Tax=Streptomyces sp. NBC_00102 TaxID=2975652 RepID=UPI002256BFC6|nr:hypothetical protein [Streptomyces sp. NBC_00102]MCX5401770.1 hypothetical protein [Streptomyces sp. NBC_00102]